VPEVPGFGITISPFQRGSRRSIQVRGVGSPFFRAISVLRARALNQ